MKDLQGLEKQSRQCFNPLLMIRKHVGTIMDNAMFDFEKCREDYHNSAEDKGVANKGNLEKIKVHCVQKYKDDLDKSIVQVESVYEEYMKNFI